MTGSAAAVVAPAPAASPPRAARALVLLALIAAAASLPRFGERENEGDALSDSDYYLDMAAVFAGDKAAFDPVWSGAGHFGAHHYARPLLPFAAGWLTKVVPVLDLRAAFSLLNVAAAWAVAAGLYLFLARSTPTFPPWLPGALFLTGFPQINWGYHLLTDTMGYATALGGALAVWALLRDGAEPPPRRGAVVVIGRLAALFVLQALAFLTRETGWIVPVVAVWMLARSGFPRRHAALGSALLAVLLLAAVPRALYVEALGLHPLAFAFVPRVWLDPAYLLDFVVKSGVAFHLMWVPALLAARKHGGAVPDLLLGWGLAAVLYMTAGYLRNSLDGIGYPLRLTFALFPLVYFLVARAVGELAPARRTRAAVVLVALNAAVGLAGTLADPGVSGVTVPQLIGSGPRP